MQITEFKKIGKTNRYKIFVDSEFFAVLIDETIVKNELKINVEYDLDYLNKIVFEGQKKLHLTVQLALFPSFPKQKKR